MTDTKSAKEKALLVKLEYACDHEITPICTVNDNILSVIVVYGNLFSLTCFTLNMVEQILTHTVCLLNLRGQFLVFGLRRAV